MAININKIKKTVFIDMDDVLCDFQGAIGRPRVYEIEPPAMFEKGFFRNLKPIPGSLEAVNKMLGMDWLDVYIATKPSTKNLWSSIEKYQWVDFYLPRMLPRMHLMCDKGHLLGDYLIDDDHRAWGEKFRGEFLHFDPAKPFESWDMVFSKIGRPQ